VSADRKAPWRAPTRRGFLAALGLGGVAAAVLPKVAASAPVDLPATLPRWIGHI
jgi:hypothetical protein